jgi:hypothetical protein
MGRQRLADLPDVGQRRAALPDPIVAAATNRTEALTTCVSTAPRAVSPRAAP